MLSDLRVCFVGDSLVAGVGDPDHLGWAGRVAARAHRAGQPLTAYNLGVRRDTSDDVLTRWRGECLPRFPAGCTSAIVVSFGVNDSMVEGGRRRVPADRSAANLRTLIDEVSTAGPMLVIGPVPIADETHNQRTAELNESFGRICGRAGIPYADVFEALYRNATWRNEMAMGDGAHPSDAGYAVLADLIWPVWSPWLGQEVVRFSTESRAPVNVPAVTTRTIREQ